MYGDPYKRPQPSHSDLPAGKGALFQGSPQRVAELRAVHWEAEAERCRARALRAGLWGFTAGVPVGIVLALALLGWVVP